jgi:predicted metalloendopeptidase
MPPENEAEAVEANIAASIEVKRLGAWTQTRNVLFENLAIAWGYSDELPYSEDPNSEFQKIDKQIEELTQKTIKQHAVIGLNIIDEAIADSDLVKDIKAKSQEAKTEADRIKNITKTVENVTASITKVTDVVKKFKDLPFL